MNKNLNSWVCLGIAIGVHSLGSAANLLLPRGLSADLYAYYTVATAGICMITFVVSFFLTSLCLKNRKYFLWFAVLYGVAFILPLLLGAINAKFIAVEHGIMISIYSLAKVFSFSFYAMLFYLGFDWFNKQRQTKELEKQNLQSELVLLKNQINPHFLFNTLNNIDSLVKRNPDQASASIIELSDMMRYMIYETNTDKVSLQEELDYIENYLELQKLQYANSELIEYTLTGNPEDKQIAPMLFIAFIENAFKHCTHKDIKHAIRIAIHIDSDCINFEIINHAGKEVISKDSSSGIGLETVRRRLNLLYPNSHKLDIQKRNDLFCVSLTIQFND